MRLFLRASGSLLGAPAFGRRPPPGSPAETLLSLLARRRSGSELPEPRLPAGSPEGPARSFEGRPRCARPSLSDGALERAPSGRLARRSVRVSRLRIPGAGSFALACAVALTGCTFEPGTGFVTLTRAHLDARLLPGPARDLGDGWLLTGAAHHVRLDRAELIVGEIRLEELQGADAVSFDPASPPPGYTHCHGGHCHAADGALVSYADVQAALSGGRSAFVPLTVLPVDRSVDLLAGRPLRLDPEPPELPLGTVDRVGIEVEGLVLEGVVTAGPLGESVEPLSVHLDVDASLTVGADLPVDRDQAEHLALRIGVEVDGTLLDGLTFPHDPLQIGPTDPAALVVLENLLHTRPTLTFREEDR